jgi:ferrochelatase
MESVQPFMCNLMGRVPSDELVARICKNYERIGGKSPLADIANEIAEDLRVQLAERGHDVPVRVGMRYWHPYIGDSLSELVEAGCSRVVTVSLSPFESKVASGAYRAAIEACVSEKGDLDLDVVEAPLVSALPEFTEFLAESTRSALYSLEDPAGALVVFSAHSLPESDLVADDPYVGGLERVAGDIATRLGWGAGAPGAGEPLLPGFSAFGNVGGPQPWVMVYQSKGARPGAWLEPGLDTLIDVARGSAVRALVVLPIGFMTDHMETLFDLDTVAAAAAKEAGLSFVRADVPNDDHKLVSALADGVASLL